MRMEGGEHPGAEVIRKVPREAACAKGLGSDMVRVAVESQRKRTFWMLLKEQLKPA